MPQCAAVTIADQTEESCPVRWQWGVCVCVVSATCAASKRSAAYWFWVWLIESSGWSKREDVTVLVLEAAVRPVAHPTGRALCVFISVSACLCIHQRIHMKEWLSVMHYMDAQCEECYHTIVTSYKITNYITLLIFMECKTLVIFVTFSHQQTKKKEIYSTQFNYSSLP